MPKPYHSGAITSVDELVPYPFVSGIWVFQGGNVAWGNCVMLADRVID